MKTAVEIWKEINTNRNYNEKDYDIKEAEYIKKELNLPLEKTICKGLKQNKIAVEDFIKVFFEANKSYTAMMNDLLNMFENIGAKRTDNQLKINFEFDKGKFPYSVDLNQFKASVEKWNTFEKEVLIPSTPNLEAYKRLSNELWNVNCTGLNKYEDGYASFDVDFGSVIHPKLIEIFKEFKEFLLYFVQEIRKYGYDKQSLYENGNDNEYVGLAIDNWPKVILAQLKQLNEYFENYNEIVQEKILFALHNFFDMADFKIQTIKERVKIFEEYLDLPFWKKRYELYSVWIFSQIYDVIKDHNHQVHVINGVLSFPFKATHLATLYDKNNRHIYIYSEMKTPLDNPVGKGRKCNIQPDYSFFIEPLTDINSSVLEIECKQYKKVSNDNFARALIDYSRGRPLSKVYLVNHGDVQFEDVVKKANELVNNFDEERCEVFGTVISGHDNTTQFKDAINDVLFQDELVSSQSTIKARLTWGKNPKDLDLSVDYNGTLQGSVKYNQNVFNSITLHQDATNGFGPEEITFTMLENSTYTFKVTDFHNTKGLINSEAKVEFFIDDNPIKVYQIDELYIKDNIWNVCILKAKEFNNNYKISFEEYLV